MYCPNANLNLLFPKKNETMGILFLKTALKIKFWFIRKFGARPHLRGKFMWGVFYTLFPLLKFIIWPPKKLNLDMRHLYSKQFFCFISAHYHIVRGFSPTLYATEKKDAKRRNVIFYLIISPKSNRFSLFNPIKEPWMEFPSLICKKIFWKLFRALKILGYFFPRRFFMGPVIKLWAALFFIFKNNYIFK